MEPDFTDFWDCCWLRVGKRAAEAAFNKAVARKAKELKCTKSKAAETIIVAADDFRESPASRPTTQSPIHPATWLNQGRYDDDRNAWYPTNLTTNKTEVPF